jgi:hypothetical protein
MFHDNWLLGLKAEGWTHIQHGDHISTFIAFEKGKTNKAFRKASGFQLTFVKDRESSRLV